MVIEIPERKGTGSARQPGSSFATAAALTAQGAAAFEDEDGDGGEGSHRICRRNVKCGVEGESGEGDEGEIGAGGGLDGVGGQRVVAGVACEFALLPGEQRHDEQSRHGDGNSERTGLGLESASQGEHGSERDDGGEKKEQEAGGEVDPPAAEAAAGSQSEDDQRGGEQLDKTVKAEGEQSGAMRSRGGAERDGTLDEHPDESDGLEEDEAAAQRRRVGRGGHGEIIGQVRRGTLRRAGVRPGAG